MYNDELRPHQTLTTRPQQLTNLLTTIILIITDSNGVWFSEEVVEQNDPEGSSEEYKDAKSENSEFG